MLCLRFKSDMKMEFMHLFVVNLIKKDYFCEVLFGQYFYKYSFVKLYIV